MKTDNREFFEQIGNLFYALAVGHSIEPIEVSELKMLISKDWMAFPQDSDLPIPQDVHFMFVEMDTLEAAPTSASEAYNNFAKFYRLHPEVFTPALIDRIIETATSINSFFPARIPGKKDFMAELRELLKKKENIAEHQ
jgi:hypothetical protein